MYCSWPFEDLFLEMLASSLVLHIAELLLTASLRGLEQLVEYE